MKRKNKIKSIVNDLDISTYITAISDLGDILMTQEQEEKVMLL